MPQTAASFRDVRKRYRSGPLSRGVEALAGVSFDVPAGCVFGLLGPNRAGKTTLVKLLLTLAKPTAGAVARLGRPGRDRRTLARVGTMHENHAFPRYLSARELLHFYGGLAGLSSDAAPGRVEPLLERVGLADRADEPIARFSKGMVQRLGLAQALVNDPDLLVLDEPTEGLDLAGRELVREVARARRAAGKTVLLVSHSAPEVEALCDEVAVVVAGKLARRSSLAELRAGADSLEGALKTAYAKGAA